MYYKQSIILYYVSSTNNTLTCVDKSYQDLNWYGCGRDSNQSNSLVTIPDAYVARHSRHLSATADGKNILISYEDSSNVLNFMYGVHQAWNFEWRNITSDILSAASPNDEYQLTEMCSFSQWELYCFMTIEQTSHSGLVELKVYINASDVSNIKVDGMSSATMGWTALMLDSFKFVFPL